MSDKQTNIRIAKARVAQKMAAHLQKITPPAAELLVMDEEEFNNLYNELGEAYEEFREDCRGKL